MKAFVLVGGREFLINSLGGLVDLVCQESTGAPVSRRRGTLAIAGSSGGENTTAPMPVHGRVCDVFDVCLSVCVPVCDVRFSAMFICVVCVCGGGGRICCAASVHEVLT